jgi:hypothetical protein
MPAPALTDSRAVQDPACAACPHPLADHDAVARRFCRATAGAAPDRGCVCRPVDPPVAASPTVGGLPDAGKSARRRPTSTVPEGSPSRGRGSSWTERDPTEGDHRVTTAALEHDVRPAVPVAPLTLTDRCDAPAVVGGPEGRTGRGPCGAQGFIRAVLPSGHDLVFCAHHGRQHEAALAAAGATVRDQSRTIDA